MVKRRFHHLLILKVRCSSYILYLTNFLISFLQDANLWTCNVVLASVRGGTVATRTYILNCDKVFEDSVKTCDDVLN